MNATGAGRAGGWSKVNILKEVHVGMKPSDLHIIGCYSNPRRFAVRPKLLRQWVPRALDSGATVHIVEHAFGNRPYEFSADEWGGHVNLIQLRGGPEQELWLQYGMYNVAMARLPDSAYAVALQDTDVTFVNPNVVMDTLHMLDHNRVGQMWTTAVDINPSFDAEPNEHGNYVDRSFSAAWLAGDVEIPDGPYAQPQPKAMLANKTGRPKDWRSHTGFSWALRRPVVRQLGRLPDWLIAGSSDWHMALGFAGKLREMCHRELGKGGAQRYSQNYFNRLLRFAELCDQHIKQDIGCVPGMLIHDWHGPKRKRFYGGREEILTEARFDPDRDLVYDINGLPALSGHNLALREGLRRYNTARNEDSIDV